MKAIVMVVPTLSRNIKDSFSNGGATLYRNIKKSYSNGGAHPLFELEWNGGVHPF